jgi:nitrate reductase gamma subunit
MLTWSFIVGRLLPGLAVTVAVTGLLLHLVFWLRIPVPYALTLYPASAKAGQRLRLLAEDLLLQRNLFTHQRGLWLWGGLFHLALAAVIVGHGLGIAFAGNPFRPFGLADAIGRQWSQQLGTLTGAVIAVAAGGLLARRLLLVPVRRFSSLRHSLDILLILAVIVTGGLLRLHHGGQLLADVRAYLVGLVRSPHAPLPERPLFVAHFVLFNILLLYLPFSRFVHMIGYFVNRPILKRPMGEKNLLSSQDIDALLDRSPRKKQSAMPPDDHAIGKPQP